MGDLYVNKNCLIIKYKDKCEILNRINHEKFELNSDGYEIIRYINENNKLDSNYNNQEMEFVEQLLNSNILTNDKLEVGVNNFRVIKTEPALERVFLEVTRKCNLRCKHCYNSSSMDIECEDILTTNEIKKLIDRAYDIGVWQFDFTGGEAFLRSDIFEILEYAKYKGMQTTIFTNLTLLDDNKIKKLKDLNIKKIVTSIDGFSDAVHDSFRGVSGSLKATISNIKKLKENGIDVSVNTIIGDHNIEEIDELINYFNLDLKVNYVPDVILPIGRAKNDKYSNKYPKLIPYLLSIKNKQVKCNISEYDQSKECPSKFCGVGRSFIYVTYEGNINLCPSLTEREDTNFCFGNIRINDIYDIWQNSGKIDKYRNLGCKCLSLCPKKEVCSGGCRSRAYAITKSIDSPDPVYCDMYNVSIKNESSSDFK